jgi:histidinol dehydrogenase
MRKILIKDGANQAKLVRTSQYSQIDQERVRSIVDDVKKSGDKAIKNYTMKFDNVNIESLKVTEVEYKDAYTKVTKAQINSLKVMKKRLEKTDLQLIRRLKNIRTIFDGLKIERRLVPIRDVGCYIPGGKARYPSTLVMCAVPARIAGVKRVVVTSPPLRDGTIDPLTLVAADICNVNEVYKIGGAQAIAALAYGSETVKKVNKIVGPGGVIVNIAKLIVSGNVSIDMVAGPTELLIYADSLADPKIIVADLVSQSEHSIDTLCGIVTTSKNMVDKIENEISGLLSDISLPRIDILKQNLIKNIFVALCKDELTSIEFINEFAPEHLEIISRNARKICKMIDSAGVILLGDYSPSSGSDYLFGNNHVLPTLEFGKSRASLSVLDFTKIVNIITATKKGLAVVEPYIKEIALSEGLINHYNAVERRFR